MMKFRRDKKMEDKPQVESKEEDQYWLKLETPEERKSRLRSIYIVHSAMLVFSLGFSIVLTGVLPYLKRLTHLSDEKVLSSYGWVVAINPLGQMIFSPFLGWLTNKIGSIRLVCLVTCLMYVLGNTLYASLSLLPLGHDGLTRYIAMLTARFFVGVSSANVAPVRAYISGATWKHERTTHVALLNLFQSLGFTLGPAIQAALVPLKCAETYEPGTISFDMYTVSGWFSAVIGIISFVLFLPIFFQEHYVSQKEAEYLIADKVGENNAFGDILNTEPDKVAAASSIFCFFVFLFNYILLEALGTPICMQQLGWVESDAIEYLGIMMSVGAVVSMCAFASIGPLTQRLDERLVYLLFGLIPMIGGRIANIPMGEYPPLWKNDTQDGNTTFNPWAQRSYIGVDTYNVDCSAETSGQPGCSLEWCKTTPAITQFQFIFGYAMSAVGYPYCVAICHAIFSKVIGPKPQGVWMGVLTSFGSLARILGPIAVSYIYMEFGTYWTFGICVMSMVLATLIALLTWGRLIPMEARLLKNQEKMNSPSTDF